MGNYFAIDSIEPAMNRTRAFFSGNGLLRKWAKLAALILVFSLLTGGMGGFNSSYEFPADTESASTAKAQEMITGFINWISSIDIVVLAGIIIAAILLLTILGAIFSTIKYTAQLSILEGITTNEVKILGYAGKFLGRGFSLAMLDLLLGLITMPFSLLFISGIIGIIMLVFSGIPAFSGIVNIIPFHDTLTNPVFILAALAIGIPGVLFFALVHYIKGQFGVYLMYTKNIGSAWQAFRNAVSISMKNKMQIVVLLLAQIFLAIALGIVAFIIALIIAIPFAIVFIILGILLAALGMASGLSMAAISIPLIVLLPLAIIAVYVISFALAPIHVFFFYYNLGVLEKFVAGAGLKGG